uniref:AlNc14C290G10228 protein n=1 Tax=Albugo laibachii Nc14 TaxID=890382 RepID=F0WV83_9STRA|nr:AlNc14C290G10228 [Albugo laibachii Nc14]|eukprot:CCA25322.1 AlNc14C290G10228 [Albugo laibachii Nc14]
MECFNVLFDINGTAIIKSSLTQLYWALNIKSNAIEWVKSETMAVRMEIYLLDTLDVALFKHGDKFLSFVGSVPNNAAAMVSAKLSETKDPASNRTPSPSAVMMVGPKQAGQNPPNPAAPAVPVRRKLQTGSRPGKNTAEATVSEQIKLTTTDGAAAAPLQVTDNLLTAKPQATPVAGQPAAGASGATNGSKKSNILTGSPPDPEEKMYLGEEVSRCLTALPVVTENAFFYAPKVQVRDLNAQVIAYRQKAIEAKKEKLPSPFMAYEMALSIANGMELSEFQSPILRDPYAMFNVLFTMTQIIVVNLPVYRKLYGSFGKRMAQDFDINQLIDFTESSVSLSTVTDSLLRIAHYPIPLTTITTARQEWSGLLSAIVARAWLRNVEKKEFAFAHTTITIENALQLYYSASCRLALLMLPNATLPQRLNFTEVLQPPTDDKAYLEKDANEQYWFSVFLTVSGEPANNFKIFAEMGLILHLPMEVVQDAGIASGFTANISTDGLKSVSSYDCGGILRLTTDEKFGVLGALITAKCTDATRAQFCVLGSLMTQLSMLTGSLQNMFVQKTATRLTSFAEIDTQKYLMQLISQNAQEGIMNTIAKQKNEVFTFLFDTVKQTIADIKDAAIDHINEVNGLLASSQKELGKHLSRSANFDLQSRQAQFERKMRLMKNALTRANDRRDGMMGAIRKLSDRAKSEQAVEVVIDTFETTLGVLAVANPFGMMIDPTRVGSLITDMNKLSKSITDVVQLVQLRAFITEDGTRRLVDILQRMVLFQAEIQRIYAPLMPLIKSDLSVDLDGLATHAAAFIAAYSSFRPTILDSEVDEVRTLMSSVIGAFCSLINIDGFVGCVTAPAEVAFVFGSFSESILAAMDAVDLMFHIATNAMNVQNAQRITSEADTQSKNSEENVKLLQNKWGDDVKKKEEWWLAFRNDLKLSESMASLGVMTSHANLLQAIIQYCDELTYKSGGNPISVCEATVYQLKPISSAQIELLASYEASTSTEAIRVIATIPTRPQFPGDTGYLPLGKLMRGEKVPFLLSNNASLLAKFEWLTSAQAAGKSSTIYVKDMKIFAFPPYENYATQRCPIKITVSFPGFTSLGRAPRNKVVTIPRTRFVNSYEEQPRNYIGQCPVVKLPMRDCSPQLPNVCSRNGPTSTPTFLPPLFSRFFVKVDFPNRTSARIDYDALATNLMLTAHVTYQVYKLGPVKQDTATGVNGDPGTVTAAGPTTTPSAYGTPPSTSLKEVEDNTSAPVSFSKEKEEYPPAPVSPVTSPAPVPFVPSAPVSYNPSPPPDSSVPSPAPVFGSLAGGAPPDTAASEKKRLRRRLVEEAQPRCCPKGQFMDGLEQSCYQCPKGSNSRMAGLYCAFTPSSSTSTRSASPTGSAIPKTKKVESNSR